MVPIRCGCDDLLIKLLSDLTFHPRPHYSHHFALALEQDWIFVVVSLWRWLRFYLRRPLLHSILIVSSCSLRFIVVRPLLISQMPTTEYGFLLTRFIPAWSLVNFHLWWCFTLWLLLLILVSLHWRQLLRVVVPAQLSLGLVVQVIVRLTPWWKIRFFLFWQQFAIHRIFCINHLVLDMFHY